MHSAKNHKIQFHCRVNKIPFECNKPQPPPLKKKKKTKWDFGYSEQ